MKLTLFTKLANPLINIICVITLATATATIAATNNQPQRQKVIDFEDELVEGMNKRPLDSLNQISERNRKKHKPHLYKKRIGFRTETSETLRELRYIQ